MSLFENVIFGVLLLLAPSLFQPNTADAFSFKSLRCRTYSSPSHYYTSSNAPAKPSVENLNGHSHVVFFDSAASSTDGALVSNPKKERIIPLLRPFEGFREKVKRIFRHRSELKLRSIVSTILTILTTVCAPKRSMATAIGGAGAPLLTPLTK